MVHMDKLNDITMLLVEPGENSLPQYLVLHPIAQAETAEIIKIVFTTAVANPASPVLCVCGTKEMEVIQH